MPQERRSHLNLQDAESGVVLCENGTEYTGDLIIGADGVHVSPCI